MLLVTTFKWLTLVLFIACSSGLLLGQEPQPAVGELHGTLVSEKDGASLGGTLLLKNKDFERSVVIQGAFTVKQIPVGTYTLTVSIPGFETLQQKVIIQADQIHKTHLKAEPKIISMSEMVVAPSTYSISQQPLNTPHYLDRETLKNTPHFNDDVLRALETIPGTSSNDFGASFSVRGGQSREVLVNLDGMEIFAPYHLKDFTGVFSYFDPQVLGGLNLSTGGYSAKYGNAMSGVLSMETVNPTENRNSANISLGNLSFHSEGTFANGLGSYLFSGRRGYLDLLLSFTEDSEDDGERNISYYDTQGKLQFLLSPNHTLKLNYLVAGDKFLFKETENFEDGVDIENIDSDYQDVYTWATWDAHWHDQLKTQMVVYHGNLSQKRQVFSQIPEETIDFRDNRDLDFYGAKIDAEWLIHAEHYLRWGVEARSVNADYDYHGLFSSAAPITDLANGTVTVALKPKGQEYSAYVSDRFRLSPKWVMELGLRYDKQTLLSDDQISPRFNATYEWDDTKTLRFALGNFHQAERAHDLQVADGVNTFSKPEKATHWLLGYEQTLPNNLDLRLEGYFKDLREPRTRYENLARSLVRYPGGSQDRVAISPDSGQIYGLEVTLRQNLGGKFNWFAGYTWSQAKDKVNGQTIHRQWEQEHALNLNANYRFGPKWQMSMAWHYHTGWRTTPFNLVATDQGYTIQPGAFFSETFPAYHRLDLRISRSVSIGKRSSLEFYIDIFNAYNRKNIRGFEDLRVEFDTQGQPFIAAEREDWLPILPSFGISWKF